MGLEPHCLLVGYENEDNIYIYFLDYINNEICTLDQKRQIQWNYVKMYSIELNCPDFLIIKHNIPVP